MKRSLVRNFSPVPVKGTSSRHRLERKASGTIHFLFLTDSAKPSRNWVTSKKIESVTALWRSKSLRPDWTLSSNALEPNDVCAFLRNDQTTRRSDQGLICRIKAIVRARHWIACRSGGQVNQG